MYVARSQQQQHAVCGVMPYSFIHKHARSSTSDVHAPVEAIVSYTRIHTQSDRKEPVAFADRRCHSAPQSSLPLLCATVAPAASTVALASCSCSCSCSAARRASATASIIIWIKCSYSATANTISTIFLVLAHEPFVSASWHASTNSDVENDWLSTNCSS